MKRSCTLLIFISILLAGCIKEDFSGCPTGIKVYFTYEGIDASGVDRLNLYAFEESTGILRAMKEDVSPILSSSYFMTINNLSPGVYRLVAWGGLHGDYTSDPVKFNIGETTFEEVKVVLNHQGEVSHTIGHLFHAGPKQAVVTDAREQRFYLPLVQNTNTVNLTTEGLPENQEAYHVYIHDNNNKYNFDNSIAESSNFKYTASCLRDTQWQPAACLRVLKLASGRNVTLELHNTTTGICRYRANLIELLDARAVDYDMQSEFDIHLRFNTDMSVDVMVDNWQVTENGMILK